MPIKRNVLSQQEKYLGFKKAFQTINTHKSNGNYIGAYVVAFSVFEDRVTASFMLAHDLAGKDRPAKFISLIQKIKFLHKNDHLTDEVQNRWVKAANDRNKLIHAAMWHPDVFTESDCLEAVTVAREADKISRLLARK